MERLPTTIEILTPTELVPYPKVPIHLTCENGSEADSEKTVSGWAEEAGLIPFPIPPEKAVQAGKGRVYVGCSVPGDPKSREFPNPSEDQIKKELCRKLDKLKKLARDKGVEVLPDNPHIHILT